MNAERDPRGPLRTTLSVEEDPNGGLTRVTLSCGHVRRFNQIYQYRVGEQHRCFACAREVPQTLGEEARQDELVNYDRDPR